MLSRVANGIYWMCRYMERAENVARFVDVNLILSLDYKGSDTHWSALINTSGDDAGFNLRYSEPSKTNVVRFLVVDDLNPNSIVRCVAQARENARTVREVISSEVWEQVNRTYLAVLEAVDDGTALSQPHEFLTNIKQASHLFAGLMHATMSHGEAWHFGRLGRRLERADKTARLLDVKSFMLLPHAARVGGPLDDLAWSAVLRSVSALEMYRKRKRRRITPTDVVDFLVMDEEFPRSLRSCVRHAEASLHYITGAPGAGRGNAATKRLARLRARLDLVDVAAVVADGPHGFLQGFLRDVNEVGVAIHNTFFALRPIAPSPTKQPERG